MNAKAEATTGAAMRSPNEVMRLERMGSCFPNRLSFMRTLMRRLSREKAEVTRPVWEMDDEGYGRAVYSVDLGGDTYSLVAFSTPLAPENRSDRVIAEAWDASFTLFDGVPTRADLERLEQNAPKQEAGRYEASELSLSRANKSVRFFEHVADSLANGRQPDPELVRSVGYLMRTTAVYGNGKLGFGDRARIEARPSMQGPFQVEMLNIWLIRAFTLDLVEYVAQKRNPDEFVPLLRNIRRSLGIGNSTGLGMAPFLVNHCLLLNNWMTARETGLVRVRGLETLSANQVSQALRLIERVSNHLEQWSVEDERQMNRVLVLRDEWVEVAAKVDETSLSAPYPWQSLADDVSGKSVECQELVVALSLELHGDLVDDLEDTTFSPSRPALDPAMSVAGLRDLVSKHYDWALDVDYEDPNECKFFWYVSETKLEPRFGSRFEEGGAEKESPLDIGRQAKRLMTDLETAPADQSVAKFLMRHPEHRYVAKRVQSASASPYLEIQDNLIGEYCMPIDILRFKLAFFGASKFDPKSELWTRINMYQGAPLIDEIANENADDWWLPVLEFTS